MLAVAGLARCAVQRRATAVKKKGVRVVEGKDENGLSRVLQVTWRFFLLVLELRIENFHLQQLI